MTIVTRTFKFEVFLKSEDGHIPELAAEEFRGYGKCYNAVIHAIREKRELYRKARARRYPELVEVEEKIARNIEEREVLFSQIKSKAKNKKAKQLVTGEKEDKSPRATPEQNEILAKLKKKYRESLKPQRDSWVAKAKTDEAFLDEVKGLEEAYAQAVKNAAAFCNPQTARQAINAAQQAEKTATKSDPRFKSFSNTGTIRLEFHAPSLTEEGTAAFRPFQEKIKSESEKLYQLRSQLKKSPKDSDLIARIASQKAVVEKLEDEMKELSKFVFPRKKPQLTISQIVTPEPLSKRRDGSSRLLIESPRLRMKKDGPSLRRNLVEGSIKVSGTNRRSAWINFSLVPHRISREQLQSKSRDLFASRLHPELSEDSIVSEAHLISKMTSMGRKFYLCLLTCQRVDEKRESLSQERAFLIPMSKYIDKEDGRHLQVATFYDSTGLSLPLTIPHRITLNGKVIHGPLSRIEHARDIRGVAQQNFDALIEIVASWIEKKETKFSDLPEWFRAEFGSRKNGRTIDVPSSKEALVARLRAWKSPQRLVRLIRTWKKNRIPSDAPLFEQLIKCETNRQKHNPKPKHDKPALWGTTFIDGQHQIWVQGIVGFAERFLVHRYRYWTTQDRKGRNLREHLYCMLAHQTIGKKRYSSLTVYSEKLSEKKKLPDAEKEKAPEAVRRMLFDTAPYELVSTFERAAKKKGTRFAWERMSSADLTKVKKDLEQMSKPLAKPQVSENKREKSIDAAL